MALRIAACDFKRSGREIHGRHLGSRQGMRKRNRNRTRAGAHVDDARVGFIANPLQHCFHQMLGFGTRDEDIWRDLEEQAKKLLLAGDVLDRFGSLASGEQALVLGQFSRGEEALRMSKQGRLVPSQQVRQKHLGIASRIS